MVHGSETVQDAVEETPSRFELHKQTLNLGGLPWISKQSKVALAFLQLVAVLNEEFTDEILLPKNAVKCVGI